MKFNIPCNKCGKRFIADSLCRWICDECRNKPRDRREYSFNYRMKNRNEIAKYHQHYNTFKRVGTGNLGSHCKKHNGGECDFASEEKTVHNEHTRIFKYQAKNIHVDSLFQYAKKRLDKRALHHDGIFYLPNPSMFDFENICFHCFYASFPNGIDEKGVCKLGKRPDGIWDISKMCYEMRNAK